MPNDDKLREFYGDAYTPPTEALPASGGESEIAAYYQAWLDNWHRKISGVYDTPPAPAPSAEVVEIVRATRALVSEGAQTGFNPLDGDWAERLFVNQARLSAVLEAASPTTAKVAPTHELPPTPQHGQYVIVAARPHAGAVISRIDDTRIGVIWSNAKRAWLLRSRCTWNSTRECWVYTGSFE